MSRMSIIVIAVGGLLAIGCTTNEVGRVGAVPRAEITYAATAKYPGETRTSDAIQLTAVDDPDNDKLTIYNVSDNAIGPGTIWVNGAFVHRIDGIPPRGAVEIEHVELLQAGPGTGDLDSVNQSARKVEIQTRDGLFTVQGPSRSPR